MFIWDKTKTAKTAEPLFSRKNLDLITNRQRLVLSGKTEKFRRAVSLMMIDDIKISTKIQNLNFV